MEIVFLKEARKDYDFYRSKDKKRFARVVELVENILKDPYQGMGKPEPLRFGLSGCWSRRIDKKNRLVYQIEEGRLFILSCKYHYNK